jgi:hypothetical protein
LSFWLLATGGLLLGPGNAAADMIFDSINFSATPLAAPNHGAAEIGWFYVPTGNQVLSGVSTRFANTTVDPTRTVTLELRTVPGSPTAVTFNAGLSALLRSDTFTASAAPMSLTSPQASFAPITLLSGTQYFFGFRNIQGLGQLVTGDVGAEHLGTFSFAKRTFYDAVNDGTYSIPETNTTGSAPILALYSPTADVPEPASLSIMAGALATFGMARVIRRRRTNTV